MAKQGRISSLIVEELFSRQDDSLLALIRSERDLKPFLPIVRRWATDTSPWARTLLSQYVGHANRRDDRLLIKRLYKAAERAQDAEAVGIFVVVFDRYLRRTVAQQTSWDARDNVIIERDALVLDRRRKRGPFSVKTCHYLRRRAWRFFRRMGFQHPDRYVPAVTRWLARYEDADVDTGLTLLDNWSLAHACFGKSEVLGFNSRYTQITAGLSRLAAAPMFEPLWRAPESAGALLDLLTSARSRAVRVWSIQIIRRHHLSRAAQIDPDRLLALLQHEDDEVQAFGADLLGEMSGVDKWPVDRWLTLLQTRNLTALETISAQFRKHVAPDRLTLRHAVELGLSPASPVARLGLELLQARTCRSTDERKEASRLAGVTCVAHARELADWALGQVGAAGAYAVDHVTPFFDATLAQTRSAALEWLTDRSPGFSDPALYARLFETPFDDVRATLLHQLDARTRLPGAGVDQLSRLWADVLLNIHRGGRLKLVALRRISNALRDHPEHAEALLPIVAVAIRSVRPTEARAGLSAVVAAVEHDPTLAAAVARALPELSIAPEGAAA